ncbi:fasciculation and elongation protein zeta-2-like [Mizuhopecten yessoensis]|uniref:Fasciculation and elongation protein zeta-2 n=1 Tax=Mizuhopecten yessoensis TaxID=6573 RepID=A0A210QRT8_MIZYE|nr:fasciculation and elongation protein zeta-2-like [Mizuhopecten yessoensis]OWF51444.1 Fasciculation and elongation protein zeta-2 [Mizuhopecten yessoensis]
MAELQFEAPLAKFENGDWNEYNEFQGVTDIQNSNKDYEKRRGLDVTDNGGSDNFVDTFSGSLEDLVHTFDEKITKCFRNFEENVDTIAPVQIRTQEEIMTDCQMWWTITGNFGNILPIDWSKSYARELHAKVLNLGERKDCVSPNLDLSDDEELAQAFDMHSLIVSSLTQNDSDHVETAEEVISEIECMMQEPQHDNPAELYPIETVPYTTIKDSLPSYSEAELKGMSNTKLNEVLAEYEVIIKELSETLIRELALRDEYEYDKELKNQFISLLLTIQKRRRESNLDKKKKKNKPAPPTSSVNNNLTSPDGPKTFLTTVIPYHTFEGPPRSEQLQIYIKILQAINEDSPTVPTLLTDYILKVLCPT